MWAIKISAYNCSIEYLEGKKNTRADMLSRLPVSQVDENMPEVGTFNSNVVATRDAKSDNIADMSDFKTDDESALMLPDSVAIPHPRYGEWISNKRFIKEIYHDG